MQNWYNHFHNRPQKICEQQYIARNETKKRAPFLASFLSMYCNFTVSFGPKYFQFFYFTYCQTKMVVPNNNEGNSKFCVLRHGCQVSSLVDVSVDEGRTRACDRQNRRYASTQHTSVFLSALQRLMPAGWKKIAACVPGYSQFGARGTCTFIILKASRAAALKPKCWYPLRVYFHWL